MDPTPHTCDAGRKALKALAPCDLPAVRGVLADGPPDPDYPPLHFCDFHFHLVLDIVAEDMSN
jgi:hypothetical protein